MFGGSTFTTFFAEANEQDFTTIGTLLFTDDGAHVYSDAGVHLYTDG